MNPKILLVKSITLLYRERQLLNNTTTSVDLVRKVIEDLPVPEAGMSINTEREVMYSLKETLLDMCSTHVSEPYDKTTLLQRLRVCCGDDDRLYDTLLDGITEELSQEGVRAAVDYLYRSINTHFKEQRIAAHLSKSSYSFKHQRDKIQDIDTWVDEFLGEFESLRTHKDKKDPAVATQVKLCDLDMSKDIFIEYMRSNDPAGIMLTGWQDVNDMLDGGPRRGETILAGSLQHKNKTGFSLSLFRQMAMFNKPVMIDAKKKPLMIHVSFEDDAYLNLWYLFRDIRYSETLRPVRYKDYTPEFMAQYVHEHLSSTGYEIVMMRVNPSEWTIRDLQNKVLELEAQGYEVHVAMVDYLLMLPTTGCVTTGPIGSDKRDALRRMRNFFAPRKTLFYTPHQLSTEAKNLTRGLTPEHQFVKDVCEKGYWDGCKTLDHEADVELYGHKFDHAGDTWFNVQRGKHRGHIVPETHKYVLYKFPKEGMSIPHDLGGERIGHRKLPSASSNAPEKMFEF